MKKLFFIAIIAIMFIGCSRTDAAYSKAKDAYITAKPVVEAIPKDPTTEDNFMVIDFFASTYDSIRSFIRGEDVNASH